MILIIRSFRIITFIIKVIIKEFRISTAIGLFVTTFNSVISCCDNITRSTTIHSFNSIYSRSWATTRIANCLIRWISRAIKSNACNRWICLFWVAHSKLNTFATFRFSCCSGFSFSFIASARNICSRSSFSSITCYCFISNIFSSLFLISNSCAIIVNILGSSRICRTNECFRFNILIFIIN